MVQVWFGGKVVGLEPSVHVDARGTLTTMAFDQYGFAAVRGFIVQGPNGVVRGGHGHREGRQLLLQLSGEIEIELRYHSDIERIVLDEKLRAILIEPPIWALQTYWGNNPSMLVLCDTPYDPADYLREPV